MSLAKSWIWRSVAAVVLIYAIGVLALMWWWDYEPPHFDVAANARDVATQRRRRPRSSPAA
jgi:hypothetical protein